MKGEKTISNPTIPYKIYLNETEMPKAWYNLRADMINKPAPLLDPVTHRPMTEADLEGVFCKELIRQERVIDGIIEELNRAGVEAADVVKRSLVDIYAANRTEAAEIYAQGAKKYGMDISFAVHNRREIEVLMAKNESPFSKIAYQNLGQNTVIRKRLQAELAQAAALGESQRKIIERIRKVTGMAAYQAKRVAQTERTRVQSQARWMVGEEACAAGVRVINEWSARMVNTRDSHAALDGVKKPQGEPFETIWGNELDYPGDPKAPAREVINCHCVLIPDVE